MKLQCTLSLKIFLIIDHAYADQCEELCIDVNFK